MVVNILGAQSSIAQRANASCTSSTSGTRVKIRRLTYVAFGTSVQRYTSVLLVLSSSLQIILIIRDVLLSAVAPTVE